VSALLQLNEYISIKPMTVNLKPFGTSYEFISFNIGDFKKIKYEN